VSLANNIVERGGPERPAAHDERSVSGPSRSSRTMDKLPSFKRGLSA
jgi:hypothetical protein